MKQFCVSVEQTTTYDIVVDAEDAAAAKKAAEARFEKAAHPDLSFPTEKTPAFVSDVSQVGF